MFLKSAPNSANIINRLSLKPDILSSYSTYNTLFDQALREAIPHANTPEKAEHMRQSLGRNWIKDIYHGAKNAGLQDPSTLEDAIQEGYLNFAHNTDAPTSFKTYATKETATPFLPYWLTTVKHHGLHYLNRHKMQSLNRPVGDEEGTELSNLVEDKDTSRRLEGERGEGFWKEGLSPEEQERDKVFQYIRSKNNLKPYEIGHTLRIPAEKVKQHILELGKQGFLDIPQNIFEKPEKPEKPIPYTKRPLDEKLVDYIKRKGSVALHDVVDTYRKSASPEQIKLAVHNLLEKNIIPRESIRIKQPSKPKVKAPEKTLEDKILHTLSKKDNVTINDLADFHRKLHTRDEVKAAVNKLIKEGKIPKEKIRTISTARNTTLPLKDRVKDFLTRHGKQINMAYLLKVFKRNASKEELNKAVDELIKNKEIPENTVGRPGNNPMTARKTLPLKDKLKQYLGKHQGPVKFYNIHHIYQQVGYSKEDVANAIRELIHNKEIPPDKVIKITK